MKDQFYIILPSNSSMNYFSENTTTHYVTQLPQQIRLQGSWLVALTEVQIPLTFQHVPSEKEERKIYLKRIPPTRVETNELREETFTITESLIRPGNYKDVLTLVEEINNLECMRGHLKVSVERGGYVTVNRVCAKTSCSQFSHELYFSEKVKKILGFEKDRLISFVGNQYAIESDRPAGLCNGLPSMFMIYSDICEPYVTGDVQSRLLRAVSINTDNYEYGTTRIKSFSPPMYIPLLFNSFQTIEIDIRDQCGQSILFDYGTVTVTFHFKKVDDWMNRYKDYFNCQVGNGYYQHGGGGGGRGPYTGGVGHIYIGSPYQRGHGGIGSFLAGIFRRVLPLISRGAKAVGKEAVRTGFNIISDVATHNTPVKQSFRNRVRESGEILKRKAEEKLDKLMEGSGYKMSRFGNPAQLQLLAGPSVTVRKRRKRGVAGRKKRKSRSSGGVVKKRSATRKTTKRQKKKKKTSRNKQLASTRRRKRSRTTRDIFDS